jgi:hypothetical protein
MMCYDVNVPRKFAVFQSPDAYPITAPFANNTSGINNTADTASTAMAVYFVKIL